MKRVLIEQFGEEGLRLCRRFYVEIPDDMDVEELENYSVCNYLEELADEENVPWEVDYSDGVVADECNVVEPESEIERFKVYPLVKVTSDGLDAAKNQEWVAVDSKSQYVLQDQSGHVITTGTKEGVVAHLRDRVPNGFYRIISPNGVWHYRRQDDEIVPDWDVLTIEAGTDWPCE